MPLICRLCLKTNLENYTNIDMDDTRIKILSLIPEIDIDVVDRPVICSDCSDVLTAAYSFKQNCLKIEERIKMYTENVVRKIILEKFLELENHRENVCQLKEEKPEEILYEFDCKAPLEDISNEDNTIDVETIKIEENRKKNTIEKTVCKFCNESITRIGRRWANHIGKHIKSKYICFICCEGFESKSEYDTHKKKHHTTLKTRRHTHTRKRIMNQEKTFECNFCGLKVKYREKLTEHLRIHTGERPFKCKLCEKAFAQSSTLSTHVKAVHMTDRPYVCEFCGKTFATKGDCTSHTKIHKDIKKSYICTICGKAYDVANKLNLHMKRHNGVKDYICEICSKAFVNHYGLSRHMRVHNGDKRFECHLCHKMFTQSYNKKIHLKSCMQRNFGLDVVTTADK